MADSKTKLVGDSNNKVTCSFCGKDQDEVRKIIAGPAAYICEECIDLCNDILEGCADEGAKNIETPEEPAPQPHELVRCRVCGVSAVEPDALRVQRRWPVCPSCIDAIRAMTDGARDIESTQVWLLQAEDDLDTARQSLATGKLHVAYFFSHEAIEKALRAFLISKGHRSGGTHSIFTLVGWAKEIDPRFGEIGADAWTLDTLYVLARYPFGTPFKAPRDFFADRDDAAEAVSVAQDLLKLVAAILREQA